MTILLVVALVGFGIAAGFYGAVIIGMKKEDRKRGYHSLRDESESDGLSGAGRRVVGLHFRHTNATTETDDDEDSSGLPRAFA
ncbi:hypothetical protein HDA32_000709 [Spinactinospora alkalitolerans]|uniref:Uncharacterized protein n=1 Tax=Spinactinospora alkalitolerans TaxID=687207 RepID=A0A852TNN8_9ACTN|nr:hypothetical protein [Spinactinospora alkalitolerans]NYE45589.1 hypothetical protein [Spinactinospora alkalitolerans]